MCIEGVLDYCVGGICVCVCVCVCGVLLKKAWANSKKVENQTSPMREIALTYGLGEMAMLYGTDRRSEGGHSTKQVIKTGQVMSKSLIYRPRSMSH